MTANKGCWLNACMTEGQHQAGRTSSRGHRSQLRRSPTLDSCYPDSPESGLSDPWASEDSTDLPCYLEQPVNVVSVFWSPGLLYLCMKHVTDRYNMYYSYAPTKLNEQIHMAAVYQAIFAPLLGLFWMLFFSILRVGG